MVIIKVMSTLILEDKDLSKKRVFDTCLLITCQFYYVKFVNSLLSKTCLISN